MRDLLTDLLHALLPDRETHGAFLRGAATILLAIAATMTATGALMAACGCGPWWLLLGAPLLVPAGACAAGARLQRAAR